MVDIFDESKHASSCDPPSARDGSRDKGFQKSTEWSQFTVKYEEPQNQRQMMLKIAIPGWDSWRRQVGFLQIFKCDILFSARKGFSLLLILLDHPDNKDWLLLNIGLIANVNQTMPSATWLNSGGGSLH